MEILITVVHVIVSIFLVIVVLLQAGKGAEMGAVLGGAGSQTLFGSSGSGNFLSKLTVYAAVIFMVTSIGLTLIQNENRVTSVMDDVPVPETVPLATTDTTEMDPGSEPLEPLPAAGDQDDTDQIGDAEESAEPEMAPADQGAPQ